MIGRFRDGDDDVTPLEEVIGRAIRAALADVGVTLVAEVGTDSYLARRADGEFWLEFAVAERPLTEPEVGTTVDVDAEGCWRRGVVRHRGPGFFVAVWTYKKGGEGSTVVSTSGGPSWRRAGVLR